jgi:hypothetical protein
VLAEPLNHELRNREVEFWRIVAETARSAEPKQPISIACAGSPPPGIYDVVDVLDNHAYLGCSDGGAVFGKRLDQHVELANELGKPLLSSETCQGSLSNETRSEIIEVSLRSLEERRIGWFVWELMAGRIVSARRDRPDANCLPGDQSVMYWVEQDGSTRPGHALAEWRTW